MKQNNFKIIGLTGGIATGKSTASHIIKKLGYKVIDADKIARDVVLEGKPAYKEIVNSFGKGILNEDNTINRKKLGEIIFKDKAKREKLNGIVHPYIFKSIKDWIIEYGKKEKIIFLDIPLLIEEIDKINEYGIGLDEIWLVYVDERTQLDRLIKRDDLEKEDAHRRINSQMAIELKREYATRIIDNQGNIERLEKQIEEIIDEII